MKKIGTPQYRLYKTYLDCKSRSKRKIKPTSKFMNEGINEDEKLIRPLLENSSILQKDGERSFRVVTECVMTLCHHLCPGIWCSSVAIPRWGNPVCECKCGYMIQESEFEFVI